MVAAGGWAGVETGWRLDRVFPAPVFCGGRRQPERGGGICRMVEARSWPVWDLTRLVSSNSCARLTLRTAGAKISCSAGGSAWNTIRIWSESRYSTGHCAMIS